MEKNEMNYDFRNLSSIQVGLASPEQIREWSHGEVTKAETINYKSLKPERDGLFCEKIFGPVKDGECHCGKYKKNKFKGIVCDKCGVEVTSSKVRRTRMGRIELAVPVAHIWFYKGTPSRMASLLNVPAKALEEVLYYAKYIVLEDQFIISKDGNESRNEKIYKGEILSNAKYNELAAKTNEKIKVGMGGEAVRKLLSEIDLDALATELREDIECESNKRDSKGKIPATCEQNIQKLSKRLDIVEAFRASGAKPENMVMTVLPVIPPDLRPMVQLDGGRFATSDLNDLYRRIINRNNTLKRLADNNAPSILIHQEKRMLQEAVDSLFDNSKRSKPISGSSGRALKSLSDMLRGKQGRFRQNLLGKRVDYSGRSVIVVGPELKIYQCGVPKEMALELFKPFVMRKLIADSNFTTTIKTAKKMVEKGDDPKVWAALDNVIKGHPVLLNRAPTLHRLGIQAFEPVLVEGKALKLHPLVCTAYNADFDGDQMAIHLPLSVEAQAEARFLMLSANNLLAPKDGKPITVPTQDMVLGSYYLTLTETDDYTDAKIYKNEDEAMIAYDLGIIKIHTPIIVKRTVEFNGKTITGCVKTTIGRVIFNRAIPQDIGMLNRTEENALEYEISILVKKGTLGQIIDKCIKKHGLTKSSMVIDDIKALGYKFSTRAALTVSFADIEVPEEKAQLIKAAEERVEKLRQFYRKGLMTDDERYDSVIKTWNKTTNDLTDVLKKKMKKTNPIYMMSDSGARGSMDQIKQLAGMRGIMSATSGRNVEIPVKANFREGLGVIEFFISSHGTRKTLSDTALRTADSGYLTRRLVDVSHEVIIRELDCGTHQGIEFSAIESSESDGSKKTIVPLSARITGRYVADDVVDETTGEVIVDRDTLITDAIAQKIDDAGIKTVKVRSVIECQSKYGVCAKCYGSNLATNNICSIGEVVGIIAAQSIGEPGTQLTMRTFHTGGVATTEDITQGLPRVEELFEARRPKGCAILSKIDGSVSIAEGGKNGTNKITITGTDEEGNQIIQEESCAPAACQVKDGEKIVKGQIVVGASKNSPRYPQDVLKILGRIAVENYIIEEVQKVYNSQGVKINDRHVEVIVRQMLRKVKVKNPGDTELIADSQVDLVAFEQANEKAEAEGKQPATGDRVLLGITKASLATESFLSAASFQETTKVLADAAIRGKKDMLLGLKENVIIGKLIPAGTGLSKYNYVKVSAPNPEDYVRREEKYRAYKAQQESKNNSSYKSRGEVATETYGDADSVLGKSSEEREQLGFSAVSVSGENDDIFAFMNSDGSMTDGITMCHDEEDDILGVTSANNEDNAD